MNRNPIWTTETGTRIRVRDMDMSHLHNCLTMVERNIADATEKLNYLRMPLPDGVRLTEEAETEVYLLKCQKLACERWLLILQAEVEMRRQEMNEGFNNILRRAAKPNGTVFDGKLLAAGGRK